jgi:hypothetical protein
MKLVLNFSHYTSFTKDPTLSLGLKEDSFSLAIKIISTTPPSEIKIYLYVYMPLHVLVDNNHHQKANQHHKETAIT